MPEVASAAHVPWIRRPGRPCGAERSTRGSLQLVADACRARGVQATVVIADVTDESSLEAAVATTLETHGRLDIVLANAGCSVSGRVEDLSTKDGVVKLDINVIDLASTVRVALPALRKTGGRVGLVGSVMAYVKRAGHCCIRCQQGSRTGHR